MRIYIDVFIWSYEDIYGLDPQVAMHHLNINRMPNQLNNSNDGSAPISWRQSKLKFTNSSNMASSRGTIPRLGC